jgi:hypothetical protein
MPITLEEMALNAGRFARFNTDLRENVAVSEACPDAGSSAQDWSHIDRFETRVQWCADNVAESDTWSLFIIEQHSEFHFAFAFSSVETALLFRLGVI